MYTVMQYTMKKVPEYLETLTFPYVCGLADVILISFIRLSNKYLSTFPVLQIVFLIILFVSIICNPNLCAGCVWWGVWRSALRVRVMWWWSEHGGWRWGQCGEDSVVMMAGRASRSEAGRGSVRLFSSSDYKEVFCTSLVSSWFACNRKK